MGLDNVLRVDDMVHTKPLQLGDAEPQIATKDEWAGYLLASGASSSGVLGHETSKYEVTRAKRNTTHLVLHVSVRERWYGRPVFPSSLEAAPCVKAVDLWHIHN